MSDHAAQRGPNYDWKHEAEHYRDELEKCRALLSKVEASGERDAYERDQLRAENEKLRAELRQARLDHDAINHEKHVRIMDLSEKFRLAEDERIEWVKRGERAEEKLRARVKKLENEIANGYNPYCEACGSCGDTGCCPARCKYLKVYQDEEIDSLKANLAEAVGVLEYYASREFRDDFRGEVRTAIEVSYTGESKARAFLAKVKGEK